jgi:hypothetical protein
MTNGNSAEMLRFEKWYSQREQHDSGLIETWNHTWEGWQARAALSVCADGGKGEAVATLHDDGYWTWKKGATPPHESNYAGWRMDVYAAPTPERAQESAGVLTDGELIAINNALQGTGYAYVADKLRATLAAEKEKS